jgi:hypothetical protein
VLDWTRNTEDHAGGHPSGWTPTSPPNPTTPWDAYDAIYLWAFASLSASPGARAYYDARRAAGDGHHQALRALGNRLVGILHGCLAHQVAYDETIAWGHRSQSTLTEAA